MTARPKMFSLTPRLIRSLGDQIAPRGKGKGRLCIINYHRILESADPLLDTEPDVSAFHWQMELLKECFNVLPLDEAVECLRRERMPPRAVCISFDDGYKSVHDHALPILKKFGHPATVFITTGYIDGDNMWNDRIKNAIQNITSNDIDLRDIGLGVYELGQLENRRNAIHHLTEASKYLPPQMRSEVARRLEEISGIKASDGLMLTEQMVRNLAQEGVEIGAHTITHPILSRVDDNTARYEISAGKQQLESILGKPVRLFAYPNGKAGKDFDDRHVQMAREAGFLAAFTTSMGAATGRHDPFQLPRSRPWDSTPARFGFRLLRWLAG